MSLCVMTWGLAVQESLLQFLVSLREALSMQISCRKKVSCKDRNHVLTEFDLFC